MRLIQIETVTGERRILSVHDSEVHALVGYQTVYLLALAAIRQGCSIEALAQSCAAEKTIDFNTDLAEGRLLVPADHPDPSHLTVSGTGLTHVGSADARNRMHIRDTDPANDTDSMKMFRMGVEGGKPAIGERGVQPEWFYKGNGSSLVPSGYPLPLPDFALDGSEEPEVAGIYVIGPDGVPWRIGFAVGSDFSDHMMERQNYLYLAHSKLRTCSFGPELLLGDLSSNLEGSSQIIRDGRVVWAQPFFTGEENMSHTIANLEQHHFKYPLFCRPGDVHVHFFGTSTLSFSDGFRTEAGDVFEIDLPAFGLPLRNPLQPLADELIEVRVL